MAPKSAPVLLYTDASVSEASPLEPTVGWVIFRGSSSDVKGKSMKIPPEVVATWAPRETQICPAEAFAVLSAIVNHEEEIAGQTSSLSSTMKLRHLRSFEELHRRVMSAS